MNSSDDRISFSEFSIEDGAVNFAYRVRSGRLRGPTDSGRLHFDLRPAIRPRNDLVALAVSTLCARRYARIDLDLKISDPVLHAIREFTRARVSGRRCDEGAPVTRPGTNVTLNFSGGFDSLASRCLMPVDTQLVSMDFGGRFWRERGFFAAFDPCVVTTNLVETPLRRNSWSFMGIGSLLFRDYLRTDYHTFGGILEAGTTNLSPRSPVARNVNFPPFAAAGIRSAPYVAGLTEIGTLLVLTHYEPALISGSLQSLANPGDEKRYRKQILAQIVAARLGIDVGLELVAEPDRPFARFGANFVADFLSFYMIKHGGVEATARYLADIPENVVKAATELPLTFYERLNPNFVANFPRPLLAGLLARLADAGVRPYAEQDWSDFYEVKGILSQHHAV